MKRYGSAFLDTLLVGYRRALRMDDRRMLNQVLSVCKEIGVLRWDADDDDGRWVTTENDHKVHINGEGVPDKGNPYVLAVMKGGKKQTEVSEKTRKKVDSAAAAYKDFEHKHGLKMRKLAYNRKRIAELEKSVAEANGKYEKLQAKYKKACEENPELEELMKKPTHEIVEMELKARKELNRLKSVSDSNGAGMSEQEKAEITKQMEDAKNTVSLLRAAENYQIDIRNKSESLQALNDELEEQIDKRDIDEDEFSPYINDYVKLRDAYLDAIDERDAGVLRVFPTIDSCHTIKDVKEYLAAKRYVGDFDGQRDGNAVFERLKDSDSYLSGYEDIGLIEATEIGRQVENIVQKYPFMKGKISKISCEELKPGIYARALRATWAIEFNDRFYGKSAREDIESSYEESVASGDHPRNTDWRSIAVHEMTHVMEMTLNDVNGGRGKRAADIVMERVSKRMYGSRAGHENEIRKQVSNYAARNRGTRDTPEARKYGRNTEFLAEAMAEALMSDSPREVSRIVKEEFEGLMRERGLM